MDYAGNSNKDKESKAEHVPKDLTVLVTPGGATVKRKGIGRKFKSIFFGGEFKDAARYVVADVLLPGARDMMFDSVIKGVERAVYGESVPSRRQGRHPEYRGNVQYNTQVRRSMERSTILPGQAPRHPNRVNRRESNDVLIASREEANLVLQTMIDCVDKYEVVSFADLNELLGLASSPIDHKWGWTNLNASQVRQVREGFLIELPPMEEL